MTTEEIGYAEKQKEYHRQYQKQWNRDAGKLYFKPSTIKKFKLYYDEYVIMKQQEGDAIVNFKDFMLQFCEIGFLNWRAKVKGK